MYQKIDEITDTSFVEEKFLKYLLHEEALAKWLSSSSHNLKSEGSNTYLFYPIPRPDIMKLFLAQNYLVLISPIDKKSNYQNA